VEALHCGPKKRVMTFRVFCLSTEPGAHGYMYYTK